ncbi:MAG: LysM domain-containing protein [Myxococcota bacterium]
MPKPNGFEALSGAWRRLGGALLLLMLHGLVGDWRSHEGPEVHWLGRSRALAQVHQSVIHTVRPGDTLASIAQLYYGDPRRESVLVSENGLNAQGGAAIVVGLRLIIPWTAYHRVQPGETWTELADRFYGAPRRANVLIEANGAVAGEQPDVGAELRVPYPLRYIAGQGETLSKVAAPYFRDSRDGARRLRRFNQLRGSRVSRGQIVLVPIADLLLSEDGRRVVAERTGLVPPTGETRETQAHIDGQLPVLAEQMRSGRYTEAIALANRLLGTGQLTGNQLVTIQRHAATAYVALREEELAVDAFVEALKRQPHLELDTISTSPSVMRQLERARARLAPDESDAPLDGAAEATAD